MLIRETVALSNDLRIPWGFQWLSPKTLLTIRKIRIRNIIDNQNLGEQAHAFTWKLIDDWSLQSSPINDQKTEIETGNGIISKW